MFTEEDSSRDRIFVVLLVVALFGGLIAIRMHAGSSKYAPPERPPIQSTTPAVAIAEPTPRVRYQPARVVRSDAIAAIYECERNGQRVLSDRPCGPGAEVRIISTPNRMPFY
jgi:hypothetical protein